jgi:hypothetical protein
LPYREQILVTHLLVTATRLVVGFETGKVLDRILLDTEGVGPNVGNLIVNVLVETLDQ